MSVIDKVVAEWAYKCKKGYPDMNNPADLQVFENTFKINLKEESIGVSSKKAVETLLGKYPETFSKLSSGLRIGNRGKITKDEFLTMIEDTFKVTAKVLPPNTQGNSQQSQPRGSSKFSRYIFSTKNGEASIILAGGTKEETRERQEIGIITAVNSVEGTKTVVGSNQEFRIENVISAEKIPTQGKTEPIADIQFNIAGKDIPYKISAKSNATPTVAGGGLAGITKLSPKVTTFVKKFYQDAYEHYRDIFDKHPEITPDTDLYKTPYFKDVNRAVPEDIVLEILKGNEAQGGPVDAFYIGDMDHVLVGVEGNIVTLSGKFTPVEELARDITLYAHIKKRAGSYFFTDSKQDVNGMVVPRIFAQRPGGTTSQSKLGTGFTTRGSVVI